MSPKLLSFITPKCAFVDIPTYKNTCLANIASMEVDRRTASPDFAAGEAQFFRKLKAAFSDLQAQCESEKDSNQRSFERNQQAIQQGIDDLEFKCSDLAKRKREIEDAERKAALELRQKREEIFQCQKAYHESEERRRRKYSALLGGGSASNLKIVLAPHLHQDIHQSSEAETGQLLDSGSNSLQSRYGQAIIQHVPHLGNDQYSLSEGLAVSTASEAEQHSVEVESGATLLQARGSPEEQDSRELSSEAARRMYDADENHQTNQCHQAFDTKEVRQGKRKRFPTAKVQALGLDGNPSGRITNGVNKRRALTPRQAEPSLDNRIERQQARTPERQPQRSEHSIIETTRHVDNKGQQAQTNILSGNLRLQNTIDDAQITVATPDQDVASSCAEQVPDGRASRHRCSTALHETPMISRDNLGGSAGDHRQNETRHYSQSQIITRLTGAASVQQPHCLSRFEPALPGAVKANVGHNESRSGRFSQGNGNESFGSGVIDVADRGLKHSKSSYSSGNAEHDHPLMEPVNASNLALTESASRNLKAQDPTAARSSENLESIARQAWNSCQVTDSGRDQASREDTRQRAQSSTSPLTELSLTSTEGSVRAASPDSNQNVTARTRGPSALRSLNFGNLQRDSRKTLQDSEGELFRTARKSCMPPASTTDNTSHDGSSRWRPANRDTGGIGWARSSSVRETQEPPPEPMCFNCRKKKRRCDRQKPRFEWLCAII